MSAPDPTLRDDPNLKGFPVTPDGRVVVGNRLMFQSKLGQGGFGAVYKCWHMLLNHAVAVKVLLPGYRRHKEAVARFLREARLASECAHANLVAVRDADAVGACPYLVMEFVEGESLRARLRRDRTLPEREAASVVLAAAEGLAAAHERGIVHRDVKPENILLAKNGRVCVTDLGLAKAVSKGRSEDHALTASGRMLGTPAYVPPEQFSSAKHVDPTADVWSLGVILVEVLTGALPWQSKATNAPALMREITAHSLPDFELLLGGGSRTLGRVAAGALRREPKDRYADCGQMARVLRASS